MSAAETQDLLTVGAPQGGQGRPAVAPPTEKRFDPIEAQEGVRGKVALLLVWTLVVVMGCVLLMGLATAYACMGANACSAEAHELKTVSTLVTLIITPLVGLVGAVTGFYFGGKTGSADRASG